MKRFIPKLVLNRETVRTLINTELARVVGGETNCTNVTGLNSGCGGVVHADSLVMKQEIK